MAKGILIAVAALSASGCDVTPATEYNVYYGAKGTGGDVSVTVSTPHGSEQHQRGRTYSSPPYKFRTGQHAYISAQNLGDRGTVTVFLMYSLKGTQSVTLESTSTGRASIATVSWLVGDERRQSDSPK
jgi:hypothetical protein